MTNTELLLEAVSFSYDDDENWWEVFETKAEASRIISAAMKEKPDEHQVAELLSYREQYIEEESLTAEENYIYILKNLKKELKELDS